MKPHSMCAGKNYSPARSGNIEVVDVDPATGCCYAPVDLNAASPLSQEGLPPSESNPRFHQQMVYAVAMKTIQYFERALGRVALWAPRFVKFTQNGEVHVEKHYVRRLRIYPTPSGRQTQLQPGQEGAAFGLLPRDPTPTLARICPVARSSATCLTTRWRTRPRTPCSTGSTVISESPVIRTSGFP